MEAAIFTRISRGPSRDFPSGEDAWRDEIRQVLFFSGLCGLLLGLHCGWQIAVESAQAVAGIAAYPADNPFYMYHIKSWTLLHQVPAALLLCGMPETWVSTLLSGLIGTIGFQAIALCALAISQNRLLAAALPIVCHITNACRDLESVHQVRLISNECWMTYGVFGASYILYAWSLLGVGYRRSGAFLLGLAPAVHPVLGAWCLAIGAMALVWEERRHLNMLRPELRWLAAGLGLTCGSFAVQWTLSRGLPAADVELARDLAAIFTRDWDNHRVRVPLQHFVVISAACTTALAGIYLRFGRSSLPDRSIVLLRCLAISAPAGLLLSLLTNCQQYLPMPLVMAMPGRFNDVVALAFPVLVLSLLARQRGNLAMHALLSLVLVYCLLKTNMMITHRIYVPSAPKVMAALALGLLLVSPRLADGCSTARLWNAASWHGLRAIVLACLFAAAYAWRRDRVMAQTICVAALAIVALSHSPGLWRRVAAGAIGWRVAPALLWLIDAACLLKIAAAVVGPSFTLAVAAGAVCLARKEWLPVVAQSRGLAAGFRIASLAALGGICVVVAGGKLVGEATAGQARLRNWTNDPVLAAVSRGSGLTLTASRIDLVQLQTRRGVLLYGAAMNQLTYVPASAPKINEILQKVYGEDMLAPRPADWVRCGGLMIDSGRRLWADRDVEEWVRLAREFGFTDVVTYADWTTKLPLVARNTKYALYHVPDSQPVRPSYAAASSAAPSSGAAHQLPAGSSFNSASIFSATSLPSVGE